MFLLCWLESIQSFSSSSINNNIWRFEQPFIVRAIEHFTEARFFGVSGAELRNSTMRSETALLMTSYKHPTHPKFSFPNHLCLNLRIYRETLWILFYLPLRNFLQCSWMGTYTQTIILYSLSSLFHHPWLNLLLRLFPIFQCLLSRRHISMKASLQTSTHSCLVPIRTCIQQLWKNISSYGIEQFSMPAFNRVGGNRSKERDRKSELVLRSTIPNFWMGSKQLGSKFL